MNKHAPEQEQQIFSFMLTETTRISLFFPLSKRKIQAKNTKIIGGIAIKKKEVPDNSKGEDRQDSGKLCFPPVEYNQRTEKERQQFNGEIIETLYPFLKEFMTFH